MTLNFFSMKLIPFLFLVLPFLMCGQIQLKGNINAPNVEAKVSASGNGELLIPLDFSFKWKNFECTTKELETFLIINGETYESAKKQKQAIMALFSANWDSDMLDALDQYLVKNYKKNLFDYVIWYLSNTD